MCQNRVSGINLFVNILLMEIFICKLCRMSRTGKSINCPGNWSDQDENVRCIGLTYFQF